MANKSLGDLKSAAEKLGQANKDRLKALDAAQILIGSTIDAGEGFVMGPTMPDGTANFDAGAYVWRSTGQGLVLVTRDKTSPIQKILHKKEKVQKIVWHDSHLVDEFYAGPKEVIELFEADLPLLIDRAHQRVRDQHGYMLGRQLFLEFQTSLSEVAALPPASQARILAAVEAAVVAEQSGPTPIPPVPVEAQRVKRTEISIDL